MEEILHAFGIDGRLIVIQILNFGILAFALWYFLYTPVLKLLSDREVKIKEGVENAEKAEKALDEADDKRKEIVSEAHKEAETIAQNANAYADEKLAQKAKEAEAKAETIIKNAETRGEEIKEQIQKDSEAEIAKLAVLAAEKVLKEKA